MDQFLGVFVLGVCLTAGWQAIPLPQLLFPDTGGLGSYRYGCIGCSFFFFLFLSLGDPGYVVGLGMETSRGRQAGQNEDIVFSDIS